jgi:hypothetical protein
VPEKQRFARVPRIEFALMPVIGLVGSRCLTFISGSRSAGISVSRRYGLRDGCTAADLTAREPSLQMLEETVEPCLVFWLCGIVRV